MIKKVEYTNPNGNNVRIDFDVAVNYMDDDIRESVHADLAPCSEQEFFDEYCKRHCKKYGSDFLKNNDGLLCF